MVQEEVKSISQLDRLRWRLPVTFPYEIKTRTRTSLLLRCYPHGKRIVYRTQGGPEKRKKETQEASLRRLKPQGKESGLFLTGSVFTVQRKVDGCRIALTVRQNNCTLSLLCRDG